MEPVTVDTQDYIDALKAFINQLTEANHVLQAQLIHLQRQVTEEAPEI